MENKHQPGLKFVNRHKKTSTSKMHVTLSCVECSINSYIVCGIIIGRCTHL